MTTPDGLGEVPLYSGDFLLVEDDMRIPGLGFDFVFRRLHRNRPQLRKDRMCGIDRVSPPEAAGLWGFTHSYDIHLESGPDTDELILTSGDGRVASFGAYKWHCTSEQCQGWDPPAPWQPCQGTDGCTLPGWDGWNVTGEYIGAGQSTTIVFEPKPPGQPLALTGYVVKFEDGATWHMREIARWERSPDLPWWQQETRAVIDRITDRHGNTMTFEYPQLADPAFDPMRYWPVIGRVVDTLGRPIDFL